MKAQILLNVLGIAITVGFTSLAQLVLKWQVGAMPPHGNRVKECVTMG